MKSRVITAIFGIPLLIIVFILPPLALLITMSVICAMAVYELLSSTKFPQHKGILILSIVFAACTPFFMTNGIRQAVFAIIFVYSLLLVCIQIKYHKIIQVEHTSFAFFISLVIPIAFSCVAYLRVYSERDGLFYAILAFLIPWICDAGAYFAGTLFGKRKLCPNISPKKTIEGLIGGIVITVIVTVGVGLLYQHLIIKEEAILNIWLLALLSMIGAVLSVLGDLFASLIKRQSHVKDFGHIMPGHGGIMDRFDSMLLTAPFLYISVVFLAVIT